MGSGHERPGRAGNICLESASQPTNSLAGRPLRAQAAALQVPNAYGALLSQAGMLIGLPPGP